MENMDKGLTVPKRVLINWHKIPQMPQSLSAQIFCPCPKVCYFDKKEAALGFRSPWWMACTCPVFRWIFLPNRLGWLRRCYSIYDREESEARSTLEVSDPWCSSLEVKVFLLASQIKLLRDHPYITSAKGLWGWFKFFLLTFSTVFMLTWRREDYWGSSSL